MPTRRTGPSVRTVPTGRTAVPRAAAALLAAVLLASCSTGGPDATASATPSAAPSAAPSATVTTGDAAGPAPGGAIQVVDPANRPTTRDDVRRNEAGVPWTLDDTGAQACAHAEFALRAVDEGLGDGAADLAEAQRLATGSTTRALATAVAGFPADPGRDDAAALLTACTTAGYEL